MLLFGNFIKKKFFLNFLLKRYIMSLASVGRKDEARRLFENMLKTLNSNGILSETVYLFLLK